MADKTEYIFEKDFWGNWKLVPKKQDNGIGWIIVLLIVVFIVCIAIITLPLWIALLGFKMVKTKRYYAGIGSLLALLYFIIDIQNRWITGFLFLGYNDSAGQFTEGLIGEKQIMYVYIANGIGVILGLVFIVQAYLLNKENNSTSSASTESETASDNSQIANTFSVSTSKPKNSTNQLNVVLGILGVVFAIAVIYFSFNKKVAKEEIPINKIEVNNEQPIINESTNIENINNNVSEQEYNEPISQDELLNLITQYYTDISSDNFAAENYFSENVIQFINRKNITQSDINSIHNNDKEFIDRNSTIINNEINFDRTDGDLNYYNYWVDFNCFRKSKNKYQSCKVKIEIVIDENKKIKSYRELEVTDLKFTAEPPLKVNVLDENVANREQIGQYVKFNEICIKDLKTNYYWYIAPDVSYDFEDAIDFAKNASERNLSWRLPTFDEIKSLYNENYSAGEGFLMNNKYYPAKIHNIFNSIGSGSWFWVSDKSSNNNKSYAINLHEGIKVLLDSQSPSCPVHILLISK